MRHWIVALLFVAGCAETDEPARPLPADAEIDRWVTTYVDQAWRADRTKTHATGEHPVAVAEKEKAEAALEELCDTDEGGAAVLRLIDARLSRLDHARKVAPPGGGMEEADFKFKALTELRDSLGP